MAKNEPNKPDDGKTMPANETPKEQTAPVSEPLAADKQSEAPEVAADKAATLPDPGEIVVSFDKINELAAEKKAAAQAQEAEKPAPDKKEQEDPATEDKVPAKKTGRGGRPPKADKADKEPKPEKAPKAEKSAKAPKSAKAKQAASVGGAGGSVSTKATEKAQQETPPPAPEPEKPPEPREAPRSGEKEEIVYLNLSELHAFKDHPFQVKNDDEMRAMVESIKDKGVTQGRLGRIMLRFMNSGHRNLTLWGLSKLQSCKKVLSFKEIWGKQYPSCVKSWEDNWDILSTFYAYPPEIRKIIYTTNIIEGLNRQFRRITKNKPSFTNDDSLRKMLYLASTKIVEHWTARCRNWDQVISQMNILFGDRAAGQIPTSDLWVKS